MSWPLVSVGDLFAVHYGRSLKKEERDETGSHLVYGSSGCIGSHNDSVFDDETIVIGRKGSVGEVIWAPKGGWVIDTAFYLERKKRERIDLRYSYYALKKANLASRTITTSIPGLNRDDLYQTKIPLPPLEEQKRIAAILDKADAIRRKRQQAIKLADDFLRSVFLEMFGDPVTNPRGWEVKSAKKVLKITGGYAFSSDDFGSTGVPVVKIGNANKVGFTAKHIDFIVPENVEKLKQFELYPGDLLMSLTGTVGKDDYGNVTEVTNEYPMYYLNQRVAKIEIEEGISKNYLRYFLANEKVKSLLTRKNRGVRQANISNSDIYDLSIPIPDSIQLEQFDLNVARMQAISKNMFSQYGESHAFFNSLSQKAFSGVI